MTKKRKSNIIYDIDTHTEEVTRIHNINGKEYFEEGGFDTKIEAEKKKKFFKSTCPKRSVRIIPGRKKSGSKWILLSETSGTSCL